MKIFAILFLAHVSIAAAKPSSRITGGKDATPGQAPYQVAVQFAILPLLKPRTVCGGSILNEKWILTSAHCLTLMPIIGKVQIKAGKHERCKDSEYVQTSEVSFRLVHKDYQGILKKIRPYDIGLLKLKTSLTFNQRVQPVKLPQAFTIPQGVATLTGWGSTSTGLIPKLPKVLQVTDVTILSKSNCEDALRTVQPTETISDLQICSGPLDQSTSACQGDIGDPLVQTLNAGNEAVQIGITSWATYPCGATGSPTVYTLVSAFIYWIEERINENS